MKDAGMIVIAFIEVRLVRTFLFSKPRVLLALALMLSMCVFHFKYGDFA